jgi:predicted anti-sigma-YlaC factor YlaD
MKCEELLGALNDYVDGETQSALCQALQEHLADCNPCRIVIDNIRQTITLYRAGQCADLPAGLHGRLCTVLQQQWLSRCLSRRKPR